MPAFSVDDIFLPLYGAHQAGNAAQALAAAEAFLGMKALNPDVVREGFASVTMPGRMEVVRRSPTVVLDAAHNPHGARAAAATIVEAFAFTPLVGVLAAMGDKDVRGMLEIWAEVMQQVVVTQVASTSRGMPADELGELAAGVFGAERVTVAPRLDDAIETAVNLAESDDMGGSGVLVTGSVVLVGEARTLLVTQQAADDAAADQTPADLDDDWTEELSDADDPESDELDATDPAEVGLVGPDLVDADLTGVAVVGESFTADGDEDDPFADDPFADDPVDQGRYDEWDADDGGHGPGAGERDGR
ncbi:MAG TPA: cyanophycin synthetase [Microlunatus sp.]|nr:cyanophycin synthetase [Microlunatus sp.]